MTKSTAKLVLQSRAEHEGAAGQVSLTFRADYNDGRNKEWAFYTPSMTINMSIRKDTALADIKPGQAVTVTFEPDEDPSTDS